MPDCGVHYLWFAFVCFLIRSHPPLQTPKWLYRTMGFVGAGGAGDFVLGIRQGEIFLFDPMCLNSKYSEFYGEIKNG